MTVPRQILPGTTIMLSRRCSERRFFLKPSRRSREIFLYALALYARRYRIAVHGFCVLSNHLHLVITDVCGNLPDFARDFHALVARATNCAIGRVESFWDRDSYSAVRLETPDDALRKLVYVLANPVAAGLVRRATDWPGVWSAPHLIGSGPTTIQRPKGFFDDDGNLPEAVELRIVPPPGFEDAPAFIDLLRDELAAAERSAVARVEAEGRSFLGLAGILSQDTESRPASFEPLGQLNPRVACRAKWKRIEALQRMKEFVSAYKEALAAWRSGMREVLFPEGAWHMRVMHSARCAASG